MAAVNIVPQIVVIIAIAVFFGWTPSLLGILALLLALAIIALLAAGLGMLFGSINVTFRDAQSFVEIIVMCSVWASPVMYQWTMVAARVPDWLFTIYRQPHHRRRGAVPLRDLDAAGAARRRRVPGPVAVRGHRARGLVPVPAGRSGRVPPTGESLCARPLNRRRSPASSSTT
ncbi:MAG: ABC transporter permease [Microbacterium sp.]